VETSLYEAAIWTQASDFGVTAVDRAPVRRRARHQMLTPAANRYPCGDGKWIVLNTLGGNSFDLLCDALDRPEWLEDERFKDGGSRYRHMDILVNMIDEILLTDTRDAWGKRFDAANLVWGPVLTLDEVVEDPQAEAIDMFPKINHPELGSYRSVRAPMRFRDADVKPRGPAPKAGEHTLEVLDELGLAADDIDKLLKAGVIGAA
jgi:crotonobetainyl-CoA:carnitine CoA-transferase CaiB-like acyl-CoA transferase